jgi:hypothetical protein
MAEAAEHVSGTWLRPVTGYPAVLDTTHIEKY